MTETPQNPDGEERTTVTIRRAPRFSVFIVVGALIGILATLVLTSLQPADPAIGFGATLGLFSLIGIPVGIAIGAAIAIAFDFRASRRAATVIAGKLAVHADEHAASEHSEDKHSEDNTPEDSTPQHSAQRSDS